MESVRYIHAYLACGERLNIGLDMNYKGRSTERHVWRYTRHHEAEGKRKQNHLRT